MLHQNLFARKNKMFIGIKKPAYISSLPIVKEMPVVYGQSKGQVRRVLLQMEQNPSDYWILNVDL